ncbi:MAG TPA: hydantoinase/oxoprolinase family protein [Solirubrobacteraceae bacterium]|jgi:N-methylhydantoinase A|nr:hydantoinase/oxoprolinase family protein [Solirubrobacteraceae bacterium]
MSASNARITCDIGGTFTDVVVSDERGRMTIAKALTQPANLFDGLRAALERAAAELAEPLGGLLGRTSLFIFSTTQATNAILEGTTARTAFLCTEGFPDILVRREGGSLRPYDYSRPFPEPYVPRRLTFEIAERIDADGNVARALDEAGAVAQLARARELGAEAVSVCLLWATANPAHELALGALIERELPGLPYSLSHQINPIVREYRRASGTAIDASLKPLMQRHLPEIAAGLIDEGFTGELLAASSAGGVVPMGELIDSPLWSVRSGPSLAPVAARTVATVETGSGDVIVCDTGGTSFDVSLVREGDLVFTSETWLGEPFAGHLTGLSSVDVRSIGAGGGSIAWVDPGGLLRVGPESARADPGPACYGLGGTRPTVTDAALVLGYIDPDRFLGGKMALDVGAAETALAGLAEALGIGSREAAHAVLAIANERMIAAIHELTVNEGVDPRDSTLVAGGGAAGLTIAAIARELGCREVLIPRAAGVLSAFGGQHSDIVREMTAPHVTNSKGFDFAGVRETLAGLRERMHAFEAELPQGLGGEVRRRYFVEARYAYQVWDLSIPLEGDGVEDEAALQRLIESFHDAHERIFAVREPGQKIELSQWKGRVSVETVKPPLAAERGELADGAGGTHGRVAFFPELGEVEIAVHLGGELAAGRSIAGPALLIEPETTIVVYPGWSAHVSELGNYRLELEDA